MTTADRPQELYDRYRDEQNKRQLSNAENFDKAILTLSTAALGFSVGFVKDVVKFEHAKYLDLLKLSWLMFALAIVTTIVSYFLAHFAIKRALEIADKYYLHGQTEARNDENKPFIFVEKLSLTSGSLFIVGIMTTTCFVAINVG